MPDIYQEVLIGTSIEKVYKAITTEEGLSKWWTAGSQKVSADIIRFPFGKNYHKEMKITELQPHNLIRWKCMAGANEWIDTTVSFNLVAGTKNTFPGSHPELGDQLNQQENTGENSLLIFRHENWKDYSPMFAECNYTWGRFLHSLKRYCETEKAIRGPGNINKKYNFLCGYEIISPAKNANPKISRLYLHLIQLL